MLLHGNFVNCPLSSFLGKCPFFIVLSSKCILASGHPATLGLRPSFTYLQNKTLLLTLVVLFRSGFSVVFPGCKANAGTVTTKGPRTDFAKKTLATQGCGRAVKFCLRPAVNPRLG